MYEDISSGVYLPPIILDNILSQMEEGGNLVRLSVINQHKFFLTFSNKFFIFTQLFGKFLRVPGALNGLKGKTVRIRRSPATVMGYESH